MYQDHTHIKPIVCPAAKLHLAVLVIKREPSDVNLTGGLEDAWWDVGALPITCDHHISLISSIKSFTGTEYQGVKDCQGLLGLPVIHEYVRFPEAGGWYPNILDIAILGLIPPHVAVNPLLKHHTVVWMVNCHLQARQHKYVEQNTSELKTTQVC